MASLFNIDGIFRYDVVREIYEGGMGIVYEAEQLGASGFVKRVAIKVIRQHYVSQKQFIENFIGEAKLVADLIHTNIVQTYHLGEANGSYYIAMELIRGVNLEQFTLQLAAEKKVLPPNWRSSSPAASAAASPTLTPRLTATANPSASCIAMSASRIS